MQSFKEPSCKIQTDIKTHPLHAYATYAVNATQQRFPQGAGNRIDGPPQATAPEILENLDKFIKFSAASELNVPELTTLISALKSGSADILVSYALGCLRLKYPQEKALFSCLYITQNIPNPGAEGTYQQTHALLVIGASTNATAKTLFTLSPDALICDLWSHQIYLARDFQTRVASEPFVQMCFIWYNITLQCPMGLCIKALQPLHGKINILSCDNANLFFQILEAMVIEDRAQNLHTKSFFALATHQRRDIWERDNVKIVGYITDKEGSCHTIHRIGNLKKFSYWNPETNKPTQIAFKKNAETGEYLSDLGLLSTTPPAKQSECKLESSGSSHH